MSCCEKRDDDVSVEVVYISTTGLEGLKRAGLCILSTCVSHDAHAEFMLEAKPIAERCLLH